MKFQLTCVFLAACSIFRGFLCVVLEGPSDATVLYGTVHELNCKTEENDSPGWFDVIEENNEVNIFLLYERKSMDEKYRNFNVSGTIPIYNLEVRSIEIEDEGVYECSTTLVDGRTATLSVEVPPSNVSIICNAETNCASLNGEVSSEISCTCTAIGAYPETLVMGWTGATPTSAEPSTSESNVGPNGSFDFTQTAEGAITGISGSVQCVLGNFISDIEEDDRRATYTYSSPICELIVTHDQTCSGGTANLTCSCDGDSPKVNMFKFFDGNDGIIDGDAQDNVRLNVPIESDKETVFYCRGCNGVNFGEQSLSKVTICKPGPPTTLPPTTTVSTTVTTSQTEITSSMPTAATTTPTPTERVTPTPTQGPNIGLIVGLSVFGVIVLVAVVVLVYCFCFRDQTSSKSSHNTVTASTAETTNSAAPVYGVVNKSTKKKSDNTDGNGVNAKLASSPPEPTESAEYASVNKPKSQPQAAPRSSAPPEKMELQYADIDHGNRGPSNEIRQPADAPTEYATVQSVIV